MSCSIIKLAKKLIAIPSISPLDLGCQKIISDRLLKIGFNIVSIKDKDTNNLWAYKGNGVTLSFAGHTDVVDPGNITNWKIAQPFQPVIKNGYLFGRGSVDMKGSIAAMVVAVEKFIYKKPNYTGRLSLIITSDEEADADFGTISIVKYLNLINEHINYCIVGEPTSNNTIGDVIKVGRRGSLYANLLIYGVSGHIAYPETVKNPIHNSLLFLQQFVDMHWSLGNKYFLPTSMQIFNISSNTKSSNTVPGVLKIECNFRFGTDISVIEIKRKFEKLLLFFNIKYSVSWYLSAEPFLTHSSYLVQLLKKSIHKFNITDIITSTSGGTSDGRFIKEIADELIEFGPVNRTIHKVNECVKVKDLQLLSLIYEDLMHVILR